MQHPGSAQYGHVSAQYRTPPSLPRCTGHPQPPACTLPHPPASITSRAPTFPSAVLGIGGARPRWVPCCPGAGESRAWARALAARAHTAGDTAGQAAPGHTCVWNCAPHQPRVPSGPWGRVWPWLFPAVGYASLSPKPRGPASPAKPLPWVVGLVTCPPCLSFPSDTQHIPRMAEQSTRPP